MRCRGGTPPATSWPSPLINAGGRNGAQLPWLALWESWHGEAVTERAVPAAAEGTYFLTKFHHCLKIGKIS